MNGSADTQKTDRMSSPGDPARPTDPGEKIVSALVPLASIPRDPWHGLAERCVEANGFYLPEWCLAVDASARARTNVSALACQLQSFANAQPGLRLIGLLPVISLWRAWRIPLPALVSADAYAPLGTPLLAQDRSDDATDALFSAARRAGAEGLILRDVPLDGPAMAALVSAAHRGGAKIHILSEYQRACLDATQDAETLLREGLGPKKLKELRRQRHRLDEQGAVRLRVVQQADDIDKAVETFLRLEASGWKAQRGTALTADDGDAAFIRSAARELAAQGQLQIMLLNAGAETIAAAILLRHHDQAFYFKLGIDERYARFSPGVQLTLEITRHLCADPAITRADSMAIADHPMINPIWRDRLRIGDILIALPGHSRLTIMLMLAAIRARWNFRHIAKRVFHFIRPHREKMS